MTTVSRRIIFLLAAAASLLVLFPACYTLFEHSRLIELNYARPGDRCVQCHSRDQLWEFVHTPGTARSSDAWGEFYDEPWWSHRYLLGDSTDADTSKLKGGTDS